MVLIIIIAFISLMGLVILHELGHFVLARRFGVKVEEFGVGLPPRIFGKKIGETIYSLNLLPFGAFVKILGEEKKEEGERSFSQKPIWQRALIVLGGVVSFWLVAAILLSFIMGLGAPTAVSDEENSEGLKNPRVQVVQILPDSPAQIAGIKEGDAIKQLTVNGEQLKINKVKEVQEITEENKGKEIVLTIERGKQVFDVSLIPRIQPPSGEGAMGVALVRTAIKSYPWYQAPWQGIRAAGNLTVMIVEGWGHALANVVKGQPSGAQIMGPVGIFSLFNQVGQMGAVYFLQFIAVISIYLALFNILPIPAVDGGKLLFLGIEAVRRKPVAQKTEQGITAAFFALLLGLMVLVTIKDIIRLF